MQVECQPPSTMAVSLTEYTMEPNGNAAVQLSMEQVAGSNALTSIELQAQVTFSHEALCSVLLYVGCSCPFGMLWPSGCSTLWDLCNLRALATQALLYGHAGNLQ